MKEMKETNQGPYPTGADSGSLPVAVPAAGLLPVSGPGGPWEEALEVLAARGTVLVHGRVADWLPEETGAHALRPLLGRDWKRYERIAHPRVRAAFLASRLMLRHTAARALSEAPDAVELAYKPEGRPYLRGCEQLDISLSHTAELMVAGVTSRGLLGVDVERVARPLAGTGLESEVCTPHERSLLEALPAESRNSALVRLWTLKEAYTKAIGQGLRFRFTEFGLACDDAAIGLRRPDGSPAGGEEWSFASWALDSEYVVGVALGEEGPGGAVDLGFRPAPDERCAGCVPPGIGRDAPGAVRSGSGRSP
ncbi:4'-phosphopantetheinyl transferase family protein [Streptomyces sp. CWNU-52B]|uniref:4'-phosphopantetheinyl transferase family protein n=1 Tax=unclassified Streptomyces TaxID=2593676 RepID=UPI0039C02BDE